MSLRRPLAGPLSILFLCAFLLAGCLGGDDDPEASDDGPMDGDDQENTGGDDANGAGGAGEDGSDDGDGASGGDDTDDEQGSDPEPPCTFGIESLTSWSHDGPAVPAPDEADPTDDPTLLIAQVSADGFDVPNGTESLIVNASAGDHVTLGWEITLIDPDGSGQYTFSGAAGPGIEGVTGESIEETNDVSDPLPGAWTLEASVTGYVEGLELQIDANVCR